jgi:branched-chain amino acid transport system substrate-binding protein
MEQLPPVVEALPGTLEIVHDECDLERDETRDCVDHGGRPYAAQRPVPRTPSTSTPWTGATSSSPSAATSRGAREAASWTTDFRRLRPPAGRRRDFGPAPRRTIDREACSMRAVVSILVVATIASFGLFHSGGSRAAGAADELTVGALLDLKAGWTSLGRASRVTLRLAVADANARLAKSGSSTRVRLKIIDVHGQPRAARRGVRRLAADGVRVVVGPQSSSEVRGVGAAADSLGVVLISQGSTAHSLAIRGDNVFRFVPDDVREAEALVALLQREGVDAIVRVWRNDAGNAGLAKSVRKRFGRVGGTVASGIRYGTSARDFGPVIERVRAQTASLRSRGASRVAVYLAGFSEVARLFRAASGDPLLASVPWYGSDGVALDPRLVASAKAAAFAARVGYPNPTLGLDRAAERRSRRLVRRTKARLGRRPDALALSAYDALRVTVRASLRAGGVDNLERFKRALRRTARGYAGVSGRLRLNPAGDRAFGSFDFWSVCAGGASATWRRTWSYLATAPGRGRIVARRHC